MFCSCPAARQFLHTRVLAVTPLFNGENDGHIFREAGRGKEKQKKSKYRLRYKNNVYICIAYDIIMADINNRLVPVRQEIN